jgi:ABC-type polar amino acid transport system ATPase subunit
MIKISNLSKSFTDKMVLKNLNLEIKDGEEVYENEKIKNQ